MQDCSISIANALQSCTKPLIYLDNIWVRSQNCGCLITWFYYQLIAKPGNKTAAVSWPDPYLDVQLLNEEMSTFVVEQLRTRIGKTPVRIILWCPITKMHIKACFLVQPLEQEGVYQKCCISLCSKVFINHFYQMKASPECLNILTYCSKYWVDRLRRTIGRKV